MVLLVIPFLGTAPNNPYIFDCFADIAAEERTERTFPIEFFVACFGAVIGLVVGLGHIAPAVKIILDASLQLMLSKL